ncbi:hypothetical protein Zm00014a_030855 [Zea mays]|uniref:Uncharacterized protein n=2 Tax=Zea mays TaxID=4577 RepID=B6SQS6_MAIZE|nr:hypothetical protein [Zea mays]ACG43785.1 hypothetical protein [Zea mays]PWZ24676.1 hypothetical protein Zm00014a_030855 [Zea mays]
MELVEAAAAPATTCCGRGGRKLVRCPRLQLDTKTATAIEQSTGESIADSAAAAEGAMRVKIVLSKQQLKQVAAAVAGGGSAAFAALPPALEQLVSVLRRQHNAKKQAAAGRRRGRWSPALQSIPEECF